MPQAILGIILAILAIVTVNQMSTDDPEPNPEKPVSVAIQRSAPPPTRAPAAAPAVAPAAASAVAPTAAPTSNNSTPKICKHEGMLDIMSRIRRVCVKGKCDLDKLLTEANSLNLTEFISLMNIIEQKTIFFFKTGATELDQGQVEEKIEQLVSQLTFMIADPDNTVAFIIAKASKKGDRLKNRQLSTARAQTVFHLIEKALKERDQSPKCDQIYRTYVGAEMWDFKVSDAKSAGYIKSEDLSRARSFREKPYDFINQSAMVFNFPCFQQMCNYMKRKQGLSCNPNAPADKQLPEECLERVCQ